MLLYCEGQVCHYYDKSMSGTYTNAVREEKELRCLRIWKEERTIIQITNFYIHHPKQNETNH